MWGSHTLLQGSWSIGPYIGHAHVGLTHIAAGKLVHWSIYRSCTCGVHTHCCMEVGPLVHI